MSEYRFKKKEAQNESKIMNASASPEENTAVFFKPDREEDEPTLYDVFEDEPSGKKKDKKKKDKKKDKGFSFAGFIKHNIDSDEEDNSSEIVSKIEDIFNEEDMSVDDIKENLASGKKVDLADVFSDKKPAVSEESQETGSDEDTYEGLEETSIEEDTEEEQEEEVVEESDIYLDDGDEDVIIPEKPKKEKKVKEIKEYNIPEDKEDFTESYRKKGQLALLSMLFTFISTLVLIYIETDFFPHPEWLVPGKYGILFLMLDLQFLFISAVCVLSALTNGAVSLFTWKPNKNSITFITFAISFIQIILHLIFNKYSKDIALYSSVFSLCAFVTALISYVDAKREHMSFKVASSSKVKNVVTQLDDSSAEYEKFSEYLPEDASLYRITRTGFISNFFHTNAKPSPYNEMYRITIPLVFFASLVFAILSFTLVKSATVTQAINNFTLAFMMALPISSIFTVSLPFFITTLRLSRIQSAIVGEASVEEFANTSLVSFADTDVFNPKGIKITSIKTYGKSRIDNTYLIAARVFNLVGGPLKEVFNRSVISTSDGSSTDEILSVSEEGINAHIDSHNIYIGTENYIEANGFTHIDDAIDSVFTTTNGRILYVAIDGEVSAKFYIKYVLGKNFKALLDSFYNLGICMAINTRDPNLDTTFLTHILRDENYPIVVVKNTELPTADENEPCEKLTSGIVSASSVSSMLKTFISADKLSGIISINTLTKYISLILAFTVIIVVFLADGSHEKITPLFIMLYQLLWSLPVIGTSIFG